ncbi:MAG: hypothetical protein LBH13_02205 [Cellulomonadaceae bacterium]|jgi:hypothetical protein|nr:hypothetical protein [Cellulomonadaceae bacterium]
MKKHTHRKPATLVLTGLLVIGGTIAAQPAAAASGNLTCPSSARVSAHGSRSTAGSFTLKVPGQSAHTYYWTGGTLTVSDLGRSSSGSWSATGTNMTSAYGFCY